MHVWNMKVFAKKLVKLFRYFFSYKPNKSLKVPEQASSKMSAIIMDALDLEREYTPTIWSDRFSTSKEVLNHHLHFASTESEIATNNIPHKLEIEYGSTPGQKLDILGIDLANDSPILVFIHGGYWQELSREISRYPAQSLHRSRIKTIVVGFDPCPTATIAEIINQIHNAAKFIFEYAEKMGSRGVYFAGHCAGAYLVAKLFANADFLDNTPGSHRLQGAFLISGLYDLRELVHTSYNKVLQLPYEWSVPLSPQFDCFTHLQARKLRLYILAAQKDSSTFKKQSREFYELLQNTCLIQNMYLEIKDNMDHFEIVECFTKDGNYMRNLLLHDIRKHL
ncbi:kynurenine formamidase-like isoform X1 [Manduca sexta]|uniref:kynurenine formamidase-like isoform X1 n=2 Tax=Manduca sexta TaxID=7130 RepID=UPI00188E84BF|nr:kynurenine formamidase-like isoform X1 [Manduca sexta]